MMYGLYRPDQCPHAILTELMSMATHNTASETKHDCSSLMNRKTKNEAALLKLRVDANS